jgi:hypothetical protein
MKTQKNIFQLLALLIVISLSYLHATEIHVSSMTALQSAINSASAGDTIILANGTYTNSTLTIGSSNITVKAATRGGVYLNGTQSIIINGDFVTFSGFQFISGSISGIVIEVNGSHNMLTQLNFDGYSAQKYITIQAPSQYNEVAYCNFRNKPVTAPIGNLVHVGADTIVIGYHKIRYCSFRNMPGAGGDNGNECIRLSNGAQSKYVARTVVEYCYFEDTGLGDSEALSVKCRENVLRFNTFKNNQKAMMVFRNGDNNIAYGNFFINAGGIRVKEANNIYCYNNYFENSGDGNITAPVKYVYISPNLKNINFIHNTFVDGTSIELDNGAATNTWANNIFKKSSGNIFVGSTSGISWAGNIYSGTLGVSIPSGMKNADPKLVLNSDGYYGLSPTSPAIDSSSSSYPAILDITNIDDDPSILLDVSGQTRPASKSLKDVGCDEYTTGSITNRPLKISDVGPSYLGGPGSSRVLTLTAQIEGFYNGSIMVSDTVIVELHSSSSPYGLVDQAKVVLSSSGSGNANFFSAADGTNYYIVVKHRNSIETWSKTAQAFNGGTLSYDFTSAANKAYGDNMKLKGTKWCIYNGEVTNNYFIEFDDLIQVYNKYLLALEDPGYYVEDVTGNGYVEFDDLMLVYNNYLAGVYSKNPLNPVLTAKPIKVREIINESSKE